MDSHNTHPKPTPTARDWFNGVMPDGSKPPVLSKVLYDAWKEPIPGEKEPDSVRDIMDQICSQAEWENLADLDASRDILREFIAAGREELKRRAETGSGSAQSAVPDPVSAEEPAPASAPEGGQAQIRQTAPKLSQTPSRAAPATRAVSILALAIRAAKLLPEISAKRTALVRELAQRAAARDKRAEFIEDRAVAVVKQTLLALDKQFKDVGFGSWMPFRYPDQWLMFTGVMVRILAANGLIYSKHADNYRRLLEETPSVEYPTIRTDPNLDDTKTPTSWGKCTAVREVSTVAELLKLAAAKTKPP